MIIKMNSIARIQMGPKGNPRYHHIYATWLWDPTQKVFCCKFPSPTCLVSKKKTSHLARAQSETNQLSRPSTFPFDYKSVLVS